MSETGYMGIIEEFEVEVPMRDGVVLRANVFRPDGPGSFPGLLSRTPYGKGTGCQARMVRAGYAVVTMDTRGRYSSDGEFTIFSEEHTGDAEDGRIAVLAGLSGGERVVLSPDGLADGDKVTEASR